jgi:hypothetical protein
MPKTSLYLRGKRSDHFCTYKKEATSTNQIPRSAVSTTAVTPPLPSTKKPAIDIPPNELWDQAYDDLKEDASSSKLIKTYEEILALELSPRVADEDQSRKDESQQDTTK